MSCFADLRSKEKRLVAAILYIQAINMSMATLLTAIAPVATFAAHIAFGNNLNVPEVLVSFLLFLKAFEGYKSGSDQV